MHYKSTRGGISNLSFSDALFSGYAADGGLLVPDVIPTLSPAILKEWRNLQLTYPEVVTKIIRMYISTTELTDEDLNSCVKKTYAKFHHPDIIPLKSIQCINGNNNNEKVTVKIAELFHGPTASFKDLSLSLIGALMEKFMAKRGDHVILLVGTTGDTGSAAIESVRGSPCIDIIALYPKDRISQTQEYHMRSILDSNVHLYVVEGTSDELDVPIKECFPHPKLTSVNAINWARIMIQIAHHVYLYLTCCQSEDEKAQNEQQEQLLEVVIPTGAAGNLTAALYAYSMGLPIRVHVSTNINDCVTQLLANGVLELDRHVTLTAANAMDVGHPYNVERILYLFSNQNAELINLIMNTIGKVQIPLQVMEALSKVVIGAECIDDTVIYETVKECWKNNHYLVCPHTATALAYTTKQRSRVREQQKANHTITNIPVVLSTAANYKFQEVAEKVGIPLSTWNKDNRLQYLQTCEKRQPKLMKREANWYETLQNEIQNILTTK